MAPLTVTLKKSLFIFAVISPRKVISVSRSELSTKFKRNSKLPCLTLCGDHTIIGGDLAPNLGETGKNFADQMFK